MGQFSHVQQSWNSNFERTKLYVSWPKFLPKIDDLEKAKLCLKPKMSYFTVCTVCQLCPYICSDTSLHLNNTIVKTTGTYTCKTSNLVYAITCNKCTDIAYIGQTGQTLRQRLNGHKYDIRHKLLDKPEAQHFSGRDQSLDNLRVRVLRGGGASSGPSRRERFMSSQ